jgi:hypothetical protein
VIAERVGAAPGRDVGRIRDRLPAAYGNRLHRLSGGVGIDVADHHGDTCLGSRHRVRGAESASGAGDDNDLAVQERHLDFLVSVRALPAARGPITGNHRIIDGQTSRP